MKEYSNKLSQELLSEMNDGASLEELRARKWNTTEGKIEWLKEIMTITNEQAKEEIKKWFVARDLNSDANKIK